MIRAESDRYRVLTEEGEVPCRLRGRIKKEEQGRLRNVVVGDRVHILLTGPDDDPARDGVIEEVLPRDNFLSRASAGRGRREQTLIANIDRVIAVMSARQPDFNAGFLDRLLVASSQRRIDSLLCLNKCDLLGRDEIEKLVEPYRLAGYPVLLGSALSGEGLDSLAAEMKDRVSIFLGPSGSGKSSLLHRIQPGLEIATGEVSESTGKGRHTTSYTQIHALDSGGFLADSPGMREFSLWKIPARELSGYFPEFRDYSYGCHFPDCSHSHEPRCSLREAVENGKVNNTRYKSYLTILQDLNAPS